jgi:exoribonuclease-2
LDTDHKIACKPDRSLKIMPPNKLPKNALVVYKKRPGRILVSGEKIEVELPGGDRVKVRPKDVSLLHPGPLDNLDGLSDCSGDVQTAWDLLSGQQTNLKELAELAYGDFTPSTAWAVWNLLEDGLYFQGSPDEIFTVPAQDVERQAQARQVKAQELSAWNDLLARIRGGSFDPHDLAATDQKYIDELEYLALKKGPEARLLRESGRPQRPESAHTLLLELGVWDAYIDPYPTRAGISQDAPKLTLPKLPGESRIDLTRLSAYAIDDEENQDPDDALSLDGDELWVHIADAAALIPPESPIDLEARTRGANAYLPTGAIPMLPSEAVAVLGLGLSEISPALSFHIHLSPDGSIEGIDILPTWVKVQRLSYHQAQENLVHGDVLLNNMLRYLRAFQNYRHNQGALTMDLPEVIIKVKGGRVEIRPVQAFDSRILVREAMLAAGQAAAIYARQKEIPIPYTIQEGTPGLEPAQDLAGQFELRKKMKRSQISLIPGLHAGLGLDPYARATSPLRRYQDLLVHQQIRAHIHGQTLLSEQEVLKAAGMAEAGASLAGHAESLSRRHWTLVYLLQNPGWSGQAVLVEKSGMAGKFLIPELAWETTVHLQSDLALNTVANLEVTSVDLPNLDAYFRVN